MKKVLQTITTGPGKPDFVEGEYVGNCTQAAIASIFELELEQVPHFVMYPKGYDADSDPLYESNGSLWLRVLRRYIRYLGFELWFFETGEDPVNGNVVDSLDNLTLLDNAGNQMYQHGLGSVQSLRGDYRHTVVISTDPVEVVWDPHPDQDAYNLPVLEAEAFNTNLRYDDFPVYDDYVQQIFDRDLCGTPINLLSYWHRR